MPYFPTYAEILDALDSARLTMWHEHGKTVDFGGPEFTLYVMEGLGKMEAPKILDEPIDQGPEEGVEGGEVEASDGAADEPVKVTVTKSFGIDSDVRGVVEVSDEQGERDLLDPDKHPFRSDRSGKRCLDCRKSRDAHADELADG